MPSKRRVKFAKSRSPTPLPTNTASKTAQNYGNIALHYLSKLKGIFSNSRKEVSNAPPDYECDSQSYASSKTSKLRHVNLNNEEMKQAYDIVEAALQYGCATDIIENVGDYFLVKKKSASKVALRKPTPGPDLIRCSNCNSISKLNKPYGGNRRRKSLKLRDSTARSNLGKNKRKRSKSNTSRRKYSKKRKTGVNSYKYVSDNNYCPKCRRKIDLKY